MRLFLACSSRRLRMSLGGPVGPIFLIQNELGFQAIALGNHEFDLGTALLADLIGGQE